MLNLIKPVLCLIVLCFSVNTTTFAQNTFNYLTDTEIQIKRLIENADINLEAGNIATATSQINQAAEIISQNDNINKNLQGHFYKVNGKFYMQSDKERALLNFNQALTFFFDNPNNIAETNLFIGIVYYHAGDLRTAEAYFISAKNVFEANGNLLNLAHALNNLAVVYYLSGMTQDALSLCNRALQINRTIQNQTNISKNQYNLSIFSVGFVNETKEKSENYEINSNTVGGSDDPDPTSTSGNGSVVVPPGN